MDKEAVVHMYNGILLSHKRNAFESVLVRWMNSEPIIQSEISWKEKNRYCLLTHIYGIQKDDTDESIGRAAMEMLRVIEDRLMDRVRGEQEGEGGMIGASMHIFKFVY